MMIRGSIEVVQKTRVAGWMYSATQALRDHTVLAFVGGRCVGAGQVDGFRKDLLDAGLGDGYCGYDFPIRLADGETTGAVIVRLQFSDMALLQPASLVSGPEDAAASQGADLGAIPPSSVSWMLDHAMLEQADYDFLKAIHSAGAYERGLRRGKRGVAAARDNAADRAEGETVAAEMLSLLTLGEVRLSRSSVAAISDLAANPAVLHRAASPVVALWSQDRGRILLEERSHLAGRVPDGPVREPQAGSIEYSYGPDRLLFVHRDCRFAAQGPAPASGLTVFLVPMAESAGASARKPPQTVKAA